MLGASGTIGREIIVALVLHHEIVRGGFRDGDVVVDYTDANSVKAMFEQVAGFDALVLVVGGDSPFKPYDELIDDYFE